MIAILRVEFQGASCWGSQLIHAHALIADNTDEQPIGCPGGRPAQMQSDN